MPQSQDRRQALRKCRVSGAGQVPEERRTGAKGTGTAQVLKEEGAAQVPKQGAAQVPGTGTAQVPQEGAEQCRVKLSETVCKQQRISAAYLVFFPLFLLLFSFLFLGFKVSGLGTRVSGLGSAIWGLAFRV